MNPDSQDAKEVLEEIRRVGEDLDKVPTAADFTENSEFSAYDVIKHFGSWNEGIEKCGFKSRESSAKVSKDEIISDLKRVADELGHSPTVYEYKENGNFAYPTVVKKFQKWSKAKKSANLEVYSGGRGVKVSDEEIRKELNKGKTLTAIAKEYGYQSVNSLSRRLNRIGYTIRSRLSKNTAAYSGDRFSGLLSIPWSVLNELGLGGDIDDTYYDLEIESKSNPKKISITFCDDKVAVPENQQKSESENCRKSTRGEHR